MYEHLRGNITELGLAFAVIDCNGIGFGIHISLYTYGQLPNKGEVKLWVHAIYREDSQLIFGFADREERDVFKLLIGVSGIGPNTARVLLSSMNPSEVVGALATGDPGAFKHVKGVGPKIAQRLVVELRDKVGRMQGAPLAASLGSGKPSPLEEAVQALEVLGYPRLLAEKAVRSALNAHPEAETGALVKFSLQNL